VSWGENTNLQLPRTEIMSETENSSLVKQLRSMHKKKQLIVYLGTHDLNATFNIQSLASRFKFLTFGNRT